MLQRIQTVYLFLVLVCQTIAMSTPVGYFLYLKEEPKSVVKMFNYSCSVNGQQDYSWCALFAILCLSSLLILLAIFKYKKRMLQVRLTIFSGILLLGYYGVLLAFIYLRKGQLFDLFVPNWTLAMPFVSGILAYLAFRGIMKDELMVRSLDRIR